MQFLNSTRNRVIALIVLLVVVAAAIVFYNEFFVVGGTQPVNTGQPKVPTLAPRQPATKTGAIIDDGIQPVFYVRPMAARAAQQTLYTSCTQQRGATTTPGSSAATAIATAATTAATAAATAAATSSASGQATAAATTAASDSNMLLLEIVGDESEACYQVGEVFINQNNAFNLAVGVSTAIAGQIAIDRNNMANSQVGQIVVDISQLKSDSSQRDGQIRRRWLESNKFPLAKFTPDSIIGLPARPYQDGETLTFQMSGKLLVRDVEKPVTFNVTATLKDKTLVVNATADLKMSDFGFDAPDIGGMLKANNDVHLTLNIVAREPKK